MRNIKVIDAELCRTINDRDNCSFSNPKFGKLNDKVNLLRTEYSKQYHVSWCMPYRNKHKLKPNSPYKV